MKPTSAKTEPGPGLVWPQWILPSSLTPAKLCIRRWTMDMLEFCPFLLGLWCLKSELSDKLQIRY